MRVMSGQIDKPAILVRHGFGYLLVLKTGLASPELVEWLDRLLRLHA